VQQLGLGVLDHDARDQAADAPEAVDAALHLVAAAAREDALDVGHCGARPGVSPLLQLRSRRGGGGASVFASSGSLGHALMPIICGPAGAWLTRPVETDGRVA